MHNPVPPLRQKRASVHFAANTVALEAQVKSMRANAALRPVDHSTCNAAVESLAVPSAVGTSHATALSAKPRAYEEYMKLQPRRASFVTSQESSLGTMKATMMESINAYYAQPGDGDSKEHNSDLLKRESLRFEPRILRWLDTLWKVTDNDKSGTVNFTEFSKMFNVLYCALVGGDDDPAAVQQLARREWEHDTAGKAEMSKRQFKQSWFQLTDMVSPGAFFASGFVSCLSSALSPYHPCCTMHTPHTLNTTL